ncbi:hypothetical protein SELMODRAFT_135850 [Selaginella moellendorffii]|uniref:Pentacotripeptide-repeat region of PRORP domain-containing protein n=2 Tax=Selaginella moellendorffii TaxID=88036 RepID=D8TAX7_SELML|nr:hypothetical protein SELMODRAFT_135850 [Selaginella moellendorffii]
MDMEGFQGDRVTLVSALEACASVRLVSQGRIVLSSFGDAYGSELVTGDTLVSNAVISMYGKSSHLREARVTFDRMPERDVVSWSALIAANAHNGQGAAAVEVFSAMGVEGIIPDQVTMLSVLFSCSHGGLLDKGMRYFMGLASDYGISHSSEHYHCMLDVLGRAGRSKDARELLLTMPFLPGGVAWTTLLANELNSDQRRSPSLP